VVCVSLRFAALRILWRAFYTREPSSIRSATSLCQAEKGIGFHLNPLSSMSQALQSESEFASPCDRASQHPFLNHVILQARYTHSSHNGISELAGVHCRPF
jgi:hypothetical protein